MGNSPLDILQLPRARRAFLLKAVRTAPWSVRVCDTAPLSVVAIMHGWAWVRLDGRQAIRVGAGDIVVLPKARPYVFSDDPGTPVQVVIEPGPNRCIPSGAASGQELADTGVRTWGRPSPGATVLLIGKYRRDADVGRGLQMALPRVLTCDRSDPARAGALALLNHEISKDHSGQGVVLDRLLDLVVASTLREWIADPHPARSAPATALADPAVGSTLRMIHAQPAGAWTVHALADQVGLSQSAFARRFTHLVGEPPMTYLRTRRLDTAAERLRQSADTLELIAAEVGYGSAFALSAAFKRYFGMSPQQYRDG